VKYALRLLACAVFAGCGGGDSSSGGNPTPTPAPILCGNAAPVAGTPALTTALVAGGFEQPVALESNGDDCRLFVVEQEGRIQVIRDGSVLPAPFLDIAARVGSGGERGLLGLAFHPQYSRNGRFFVNYTDRNGDTHIAEFQANPPTSDTADPASERLLLFVGQPFANHNGGGLAFGPRDGFLYIALGDGGSGGDPFGNGQGLGTHLGKMLRIDVDSGSPYGVPASNPFVSTPGAKPEIWAYGLRNPWRLAFDRETGDMLIADVGQNAVEEIDLGLASRGGGENYGWNITEGSACFSPRVGCNKSGLTLPVVEYSQAEGGCAVMGGVVYRGSRMPGYHGTYFYSDFCQPFVRSFRVANGQAVDARDWTASLGRGLGNVSAFGTDVAGEAYIVDYGGEIYQILPAS
jgi:glucose/arabinose dehydrogenase